MNHPPTEERHVTPTCALQSFPPTELQIKDLQGEWTNAIFLPPRGFDIFHVRSCSF